MTHGAIYTTPVFNVRQYGCWKGQWPGSATRAGGPFPRLLDACSAVSPTPCLPGRVGSSAKWSGGSPGTLPASVVGDSPLVTVDFEASAAFVFLQLPVVRLREVFELSRGFCGPNCSTWGGAFEHLHQICSQIVFSLPLPQTSFPTSFHDFLVCPSFTRLLHTHTHTHTHTHKHAVWRI